jgi:hypothetical protein
MRAYIRNALILSFVAGIAGVGCSSSDDSGAGGAGGAAAGSAGASASGGTSQAGSSGKGNTGGGGASAGGTGGSAAGGSGGTPTGGSGGSFTGSPEAGAGDAIAGAGNSEAGAPSTGPAPCNDLVFTGTNISGSHAAVANAPALAYGTLNSGDYLLTSQVVYDGMNEVDQVGGIAHVSIADKTATIDVAINGANSRVVLVMAQPTTAAPTSVIITCSNDPILGQVVGQEAKTLLTYGVTPNTFSLYEVPLKKLLVFTLQP